MNLDTSLSLEVVITILAIAGAVWRLEARIIQTRAELKGDIAELRAELKGDIAELRTELKGEIRRLETRIDRLEEKVDEVRQRLEVRIENVETKVDDGNQRLARLEGRFEGREERLASEGEADPAT